MHEEVRTCLIVATATRATTPTGATPVSAQIDGDWVAKRPRVRDTARVFDIDYILEHHTYLIYLVVLVWTFFEGETIVIIVGAAAAGENSRVFLPLLILCAFCGSVTSDQIMFFLGRYKGKAFIARRPKWQQRAERVYRILEKHQTWLILGFRFLYGLRNITPFAIGMSEVRTRRFLTLNVIGGVIWAVTFACAGYLFGEAVESVFAKGGKWVVIGAVVGVALVVWVIRHIRRRRKPAAENAPEQTDKPA